MVNSVLTPSFQVSKRLHLLILFLIDLFTESFFSVNKNMCKTHHHLVCFFIWNLKVSPAIDNSTQIHRVHCNLDLTYIVMFGETIKVEDGEYEGPGSQIGIRHLKKETKKH